MPLFCTHLNQQRVCTPEQQVSQTIKRTSGDVEDGGPRCKLAPPPALQTTRLTL